MIGIPWQRATLTWMLMMLVETAHGFLRVLFLEPKIGALRADQWGVLLGSLLVVLIAWACARWLRLKTPRAQFAVGGLWVILTLVFEFSLGRAVGFSWQNLLSNYNPAHGGYMLLGLAVMFVAPWLVAPRKNQLNAENNS